MFCYPETSCFRYSAMVMTPGWFGAFMMSKRAAFVPAGKHWRADYGEPAPRTGRGGPEGQGGRLWPSMRTLASQALGAEINGLHFGSTLQQGCGSVASSMVVMAWQRSTASGTVTAGLLVTFLNELRDLKVDLLPSTSRGWTLPRRAGACCFRCAGCLAEFERAMISERVLERGWNGYGQAGQPKARRPHRAAPWNTDPAAIVLRGWRQMAGRGNRTAEDRAHPRLSVRA